MIRLSMPLAAVFTVAWGLVLAGCAGEPPTQARPGFAETLILAHTPPPGMDADVASATSSPPAYTHLEAASAAGTPGSVELSVHAGGAIPRFPDDFVRSVAVFGFAWVDLGGGQAVVAVIHPTIGGDSHQNPDGWHTHPVVTTTGTATSDFCVAAIGQSEGGISILGDVLRLSMPVGKAGLEASALDVAAAFIVQGDAGCTATGLGVKVLSVVTL